ncbi:MAG: hypothetical protein WKF97_22105 [Chitinophagaceae bacterium]
MKNNEVKKLSLADFKAKAEKTSKTSLMESIVGGVKNACHPPPTFRG